MKINPIPDIIDCRSEIIGAMGECAMGSIFDAKSPIVGVMDTHARFVIFQMIPAFRVTCCTVKIRAPEKTKRKLNYFLYMYEVNLKLYMSKACTHWAKMGP